MLQGLLHPVVKLTVLLSISPFWSAPNGPTLGFEDLFHRLVKHWKETISLQCIFHINHTLRTKASKPVLISQILLCIKLEVTYHRARLPEFYGFVRHGSRYYTFTGLPVKKMARKDLAEIWRLQAEQT
ncbi:hypothetical protein SELMODRAFT_431645 [Selaginella moellendorffii]|uniref:Secreted protein n=1 Tax=Selaginella moellendorffii TaxID=88036 RepID=D8TDB9_SELML|nr:hypothetical protein SELMODRAFT_431645 [Selaginella moellendorffii]